MSQQELDISYLLEITPDTRFISACYQTLLERTINPMELRYAVQMLNSGLTKKGFIYWVCHSPEFGNRFVIKNLNKYRLPCYLYKGYEKLTKSLKLAQAPKIMPGTLPPQDSDCMFGYYVPSPFPGQYSFETEYSALSCGQISIISSLLQKETMGKSWTVSGFLTSEFTASDLVLQTIPPEDFISKPCSCCPDNTLITSPPLIFQILTNETLYSLQKYTKDTFIFTMPVLPSFANSLSVIWNIGWGGYESANGIFSRWLKGLYNQSSIYFINNSPDFKKISASFTLMCPYPDSLVQMKYGNTVIEISLKKTACDVDFQIQLNPGYNEIKFQYCGPHYVPEGEWARSAKFAIANLQLSNVKASDDKIYGLEAYQLSEEELGTGYYPYLLPESVIRSQLHRNGFFEIQAYSVSQTYAVNKLAHTRYYYPAAERDRDCYYPLENGQSNHIPKQFPSLTIYIARRTSPFVRESFHG